VEPTAWRGGYWPLRMPFCAGANLWYRRRPSIPVALTALALAVPVVDQLTVKSLAVHVHAVYAGYGVPEPPASVIVTYLVVVGAIGTVSWLIAIWAIRHHRRWARPVATALFLLATGLAVVNLTASEYGNQTVLPQWLGLVGLLPCLAGLVAVIPLWRGIGSSAGRTPTDRTN
jgi:uncharacterized membrane protein YidH (DUF202 family)